MNVTYYEVDKDLKKFLDNDVIDATAEFDDLKEHAQVAVCFVVREKSVKGKGGKADTFEPVPPKGPPVSLKKISPAIGVLIANEPKFLLIVDKYFWGESDKKQRYESLFCQLTRINVESQDDGEPKATIKPWDFQDNFANIKKCGAHTPQLLMVGELLAKVIDQSKQAVEAELTRRASASAKAAPKALSKPAAEMPSDEEPEPGEPPRVRARAIPVKSKTSPLKGEQNGEQEERVLPARKPPMDAEAEDAPPVPDDE